MNYEVRMLGKPDLNEPYIVCGLPGSGYVGKLAVDHMVQELKGKLFAEIYSPAFPPQVVVRQDGSANLMKNELYSCRTAQSSRDLILYTGDSQPTTAEAEYEVADKVLELVQSLGGKRVFTLAAYITGYFVEKPRVFGTATDIELVRMLKKYDVSIMKEGNITGMNGLLIGMAKIKSMEGVSLLGETSGYIVDAKASQAVLEILVKMLDLKIEMKTLEEHAKETEAVIQRIEELRQKGNTRRQAGKELGYIS